MDDAQDGFGRGARDHDLVRAFREAVARGDGIESTARLLALAAARRSPDSALGWLAADHPDRALEALHDLDDTRRLEEGILVASLLRDRDPSAAMRALRIATVARGGLDALEPGVAEALAWCAWTVDPAAALDLIERSGLDRDRLLSRVASRLAGHDPNATLDVAERLSSPSGRRYWIPTLAAAAWEAASESERDTLRQRVRALVDRDFRRDDDPDPDEDARPSWDDPDALHVVELEHTADHLVRLGMGDELLALVPRLPARQVSSTTLATLAEAFARHGQPPRAMGLIEQARLLAERGVGPDWSSELWIARTLGMLGSTQEARAAVRAALERAGSSDRAWRTAAKDALAWSTPDEALAIAERAPTPMGRIASLVAVVRTHGEGGAAWNDAVRAALRRAVASLQGPHGAGAHDRRERTSRRLEALFDAADAFARLGDFEEALDVVRLLATEGNGPRGDGAHVGYGLPAAVGPVLVAAPDAAQAAAVLDTVGATDGEHVEDAGPTLQAWATGGRVEDAFDLIERMPAAWRESLSSQLVPDSLEHDDVAAFDRVWASLPTDTYIRRAYGVVTVARLAALGEVDRALTVLDRLRAQEPREARTSSDVLLAMVRSDLVRMERFDLAERAVRSLGARLGLDDYHRANAYLALASDAALASDGSGGSDVAAIAEQLAEDAVALALDCPEWERIDLELRAAGAFARLGAYERAIELTRRVDADVDSEDAGTGEATDDADAASEVDTDSVWLEIAGLATQTGAMDAAHAAAAEHLELSREGSDRSAPPARRRFETVTWVSLLHVWTELAEAAIARGMPDRAREAAQRAVQHAESGWLNTASEVEAYGTALALARAHASTPSGEEDPDGPDDELLERIVADGVRSIAAAKLAELGDVGRAWAIARAITTPAERAAALLDIAAAGPDDLASHGDHPTVREALGALATAEENRFDDVERLLGFDPSAPSPHDRIVTRLVDLGMIDRALQHAEAVDAFGDGRQSTHLRLADVLRARGLEADALRALRGALPRDGSSYLGAGRMLGRVVQGMTALGALDEALAILAAWQDEDALADALRMLGPMLPSADALRQALAIADGITGTTTRWHTRSELLATTAQAGAIPSAELASLLEPTERQEAVEEVVRAAARDGDAVTFAALAPRVVAGPYGALVALQGVALWPEVGDEIVDRTIAASVEG